MNRIWRAICLIHNPMLRMILSLIDLESAEGKGTTLRVGIPPNGSKG